MKVCNKQSSISRPKNIKFASLEKQSKEIKKLGIFWYFLLLEEIFYILLSEKAKKCMIPKKTKKLPNRIKMVWIIF